MSTLALQQQRLRDAVACGAAPGDLLQPRSGGEPLLRLYQHAYRARLVAALRDNFGVLPRAMGDEAFDELALAYLQAHPSRHPSIRWFGDRLPAFMAERDDLVPHTAFVDLARMEWALRTAFDAADAPALTTAELAARAPEQWASWVLRFQPSAQLLALRWYVEPAWRALQSGADDEPGLPEPEHGEHALLVWRPLLETRWRSVTNEVEALLLPAAMQGQDFSVLCEQAAQQVGDEQAAAAVVGVLRQWVGEGLLATEGR